MTLLAYAIHFAVLIGLGWTLAARMARVYGGTLPCTHLRLCVVSPDKGMAGLPMRWRFWPSTLPASRSFCAILRQRLPSTNVNVDTPHDPDVHVYRLGHSDEQGSSSPDCIPFTGWVGRQKLMWLNEGA